MYCNPLFFLLTIYYLFIEIYNGVALLTDRHVAEANIANGLNQSELYKVGVISSGARGLLVAMVCYGISDTFVKPGNNSSHTGAIPMNSSQIRGSFATLIDIKKQTKGIAIGHECTEMNIRRWISELQDAGLIKGGSSSFGVGRSLNLGRSEKVRKLSIHLPQRFVLQSFSLVALSDR